MKLTHSWKKLCCLAVAAASISGMALAASPQATYEEAAKIGGIFTFVYKLCFKE